MPNHDKWWYKIGTIMIVLGFLLVFSTDSVGEELGVVLIFFGIMLVSLTYMNPPR